MVGAAAFAYGMLMSFILSGASRNVKLRRPHPPLMIHVGYLLCGISAGVAILAGYTALRSAGIV